VKNAAARPGHAGLRGDLLLSGAALTNVNDIRVILVDPGMILVPRTQRSA
jgi:hypothetical protein